MTATKTAHRLKDELLRGAGLRARIAPAPRAVEGSVPCGMSLLVRGEDVGSVRAFAAEHRDMYRDIVEVPCQIQPDRGKFC